MPSTVIYGMLYSPAHRTLDVVFRGDGGTYRYYEVSAEEWKAFRRSSSKGTYLNAVFKQQHPRVDRIGLQPTEFNGALLASTLEPALTPCDLPDTNVWGFYD